jgi:two-component system sensor histidine kinase BaeS
MPDRVWFRSLYWRVAFGFVGFLAVVLVVQGGMLFWLVARSSDDVGGRTPYDLATLVASDLGNQMAAGTLPSTEAYLREHYGGVSRPVGIITADGKVLVSRPGDEIPPQLVDMALRRLRGGGRRPQGGPPMPPGMDPRRPDFGPGPFGPPPGADPSRLPGMMPGGPPAGNPPPAGTPAPGVPTATPAPQTPGGTPAAGGEGRRGQEGQAPDGRRNPPGPGRRMMGIAPVLKDGVVVAVVVVPPAEPLPILLREFAPTALTIALGLLAVATTLAALFVFRPAQQRLRALEDAARQLGAGVLTARAPVAGGDEVTSVARTFNAMADELDRRTTALKSATEARKQLLADVSHELMTPLTAIRGYLETLQMTELQLDDDARRRYLGIVSAEAERLEQITGDLLDLARFEAGGGTLTMTPVDVTALFTRVTERHERLAEEKSVRLFVTVGRDAEAVTGDAGRLEQVFQNLAANALRHTPSGGEVELRSERRDDGVVLLVRDTGEGIAPEHLDHVFDRFYKADEARGADGRGSGLGLSIAKAIIERHGGRITVRSDPGRETVFEVWLGLGARA